MKYSAGAFGAVSLSSLNFGCGGGGGEADSVDTFPVLVFSDIHFNPFYDPLIFAALDAAPASDWAGIFQTSSVKAPSAWAADTNYPSLVLALASVSQNLGKSPFVIYTGDLLGHLFPVLFRQYNGGVQNEAAMKVFADKTVAFVTAQIRAAVGNLPVMFVLGNADSYVGLLPEPSFLANTAELFYTNFLNGSVDHQAFLGSFTQGGYYAAQPPGINLTVIGLNTVLFGYAQTESEVQAELKWLDSSLASAQAAGRKVWLLMHVPPGAVLGATATAAGNVASDGHITTATMMWTPGRYESLMAILASYPGLVTMTLAAHTHMDEYRVLSPGNVLEVTPAISPKFGNNPAFKVFSIAGESLRPIDYRVFNYDLASMPGQFNSYYSFSSAYSMQGFLDVTLSELRPILVTNGAKQALYRGLYYSGNNASNPITNTNWPIYWSGIGKMVPQEFIDSVNSY
ncbi:MAG: putative lipoprotein [Proteobacteria bacterium]|nr:putative lipoprotein [Pseudomonadota bacterium]